jgi:uncharacterized membrane protein
MTTATRDQIQLARGLGWLSIGLGAAEIAAPRALARVIGLRDDRPTRNTMIALGLREIAQGVAILTQPQSPRRVWSRVGGDVIDLALLGKSWSGASDRNRVALATAAVAGVTVVDLFAARQLSRGASGRKPIHVVRAITLNRPPNEVYAFWREFENLPRFMQHLEEVSVVDDRRSHWKAKAPAGTAVEWDAEIVEDRPNELISWRSLEGAGMPNNGSVRFAPAPGDRGTEVLVELLYEPPAGTIGATIAKLFGREPGQQVSSDLRRFKQVMETGEVVHSDASIHRMPHPARPPAQSM